MDNGGRKHLPPHMIGDPHQRHDGKHPSQRADVDRDQKHQCGDDHRTGERFPRMEAHRRPGSRRLTRMVDRVGDPEWGRPVHPAVSPVKPCVVRNEEEQHGNRQPPQRKIMRVAINPRPAARLPAPRHNPRWHTIDRCRGEAPADLAPYLRPLSRQPRREAPSRPQREAAARRDIAQRHDQRHRQRGKEEARHGAQSRRMRAGSLGRR